MAIADGAKSGAGGAGAALARFLAGAGALVTFPVAVTFALTGQFILAALIAGVAPAPEGSGGAMGGVTTLQIVVLFLQGAALVYAAARGPAGFGRIFLALAALLWAVGALLLMYVWLQCSVGGVCL